MQFLLALVFGILVALAVQPKQEERGAIWLHPLAGGMAGVFPHIDSIIYYLSGYGGILYGISWSLILAPASSLAIAWFISGIAGANHHWSDFYRTTLITLIASLFMAMLSSEGVFLFAPLHDMRIALNLFYPFDLTIFMISLIGVVIAYLLRGFKSEVARIALVAIVAYLGVLTTFKVQAHNFANKYATAFNLEVKTSHIMPQPISPLNWRITIETKDHRLHDTLINLFRNEEKNLKDTSTRAARIHALYKPMSQAVWRVYNRFGNVMYRKFNRSAWTSVTQANNRFSWEGRFTVSKGMAEHKGDRCAKFRDLRKDGSRRSKRGDYLICKAQNNEAKLYLSDKHGNYRQLDI